jgi:ABC-2 type transport system permease protein
MKQFPILLRREFWEHRNTFIVLPAVVAGFMILVMVGLFVTSGFTSVNAHISISGENESEEWRLDADHESMDEAIGYMLSNLRHMSEAERELRLFKVFHALSVPFFIVLMVVVLFYLLGSLYEDRKDRSILFWKSMPVSDLATVSIKLFTGLVAVPAVYLACVAIVQVMLLLIASLAALGHDVEIFKMLWVPSNLVGRWFTDIAYLLLQAIWSLPMYGWMVLVSAFAKSVPLAWFLGIPIAIAIVEGMVFNGGWIGNWMADHGSPTPHSFNAELHLADLTPYLASLDTFLGLLVGAGFIGGAIWLRGKGDEL